ncbi:30S ribosomal protein S11 [Patescibacteria group bacterium]|nr:30S ribosomal protein S11 [Patescibacteria group bacterium]
MAKKEKVTKQTKKLEKKKKNLVTIASVSKVIINCTYNNTIISITNLKGDLICWGTSGIVGFKGAKRSTPYAATLCAEDIARRALEKGVESVDIITKGPGISKISAIKALKQAGLKIVSIYDKTPIPHNGCRSRKRRRN